MFLRSTKTSIFDVTPLRWGHHRSALTARSMATYYHQHVVPTTSEGQDLEYSDDIFIYTRGRFVCDEEYEMSQRQVHFDVKALACRAAEAVGAKSCVRVEKYPDGMYNKTMLLTMNNNSQIVAKIPNPNAGIPHYTTASEVATMDFARNVLGAPVPKVLAWGSRSQKTPVGAEYIIMEKAPGIELERVWPTMNIKDRFALVKSLAGFQKAWSSISFEGYGSLYYAKDLESASRSNPLYTDVDGNLVTTMKYAIGPSVGRETIDDRRATITFDRGPWDSLEQYHTAIANREIACVQGLSELPKSPITLCGPGTYQPTRERKLKALHCYLKLMKYLLPLDQAISSAHLWHGDLHVANIFVNPSKPTEIVSLIDWQSTEISPLYFHARQPHIIDYDGPPIHGLERPQLPKDLAELEPETRNQAEKLYLQQSLCSLYNTLTHGQNPKVYAAFEFQQTMSYLLLLLARNLLIDGEATYLLQAAELESTWDTLPTARGSAYPLSFSEKERGQMEADVEDAERGMEVMRSIRESLGGLFPEQGIVRPEEYQEALEAFESIKCQVIEEFATTELEAETWQKVWPFGT